jgi:isopentenyldiphosphate isomerase
MASLSDLGQLFRTLWRCLFNRSYDSLGLIMAGQHYTLRTIRTVDDSEAAMLVDVVDDRNKVVARADRSVLLQNHLNFRTVHVLLTDARGRLVLQQLSPTHPRSPNRIGSSAAGYLLTGETYLDAAYRRLDAELDVRPPLRFVGEIDVMDEGSRKFVGVYSGSVRQKPKVKDPLVVALMTFDLAELDSLVGSTPLLFTSTFMAVYERFRRQSP